MNPEKLLLDAQNPRLVQFGVTAKSSQLEIITVLWTHMAVSELVHSILNDGFWKHEPMLYIKEKGKQVVIEGNRRLAAVKIILDPKIQEALDIGPYKIKPSFKGSLVDLPVEYVSSRYKAWRYIGFKHVSGPVRWTSYAKAQYIDDIRKSKKLDLQAIADQLGDDNKTIERLYRALKVIQQAESSRIWSRDHAYKKNLAFSHLMTGLQYKGFQEFLGLDKKGGTIDKPVPKAKIESLGQLCIWLWGDQRTNTPPIIKSQNPDLRRLDKVLQTSKSIARLHSSSNLELAVEATKDDHALFIEGLDLSDKGLRTALSSAPSGYSGTDEEIEMIDDIHKKANSLRFIASKGS